MRTFAPKNPRTIDLTGRRFGRLAVLGQTDRPEGSRDNSAFWACRCDCSALISVRAPALILRGTASCGCYRRENAQTQKTTHGLSLTPEYRAWAGIIQRCTNPKQTVYADYGGRGITVCDRWRDSFEAFFQDMGRRPSPEHSIDRRNNDGDYEPGNVRWATKEKQAQNRRRSVMTAELAREVRALKAAGGNVAAWARQHRVSPQVAHKAASGKTWKDAG